MYPVQRLRRGPLIALGITAALCASVVDYSASYANGLLSLEVTLSAPTGLVVAVTKDGGALAYAENMAPKTVHQFVLTVPQYMATAELHLTPTG
jgi:molecular chaperone DnaK (HSP70)